MGPELQIVIVTLLFLGLLTAVGGRDDRHVGLEADQLREVLARLRDVVDDEDADRFSHERDS